MVSREQGVESFLRNANNTHNFKYDYSSVVYINRSTKVEIICKEHGSFWQNPSAHQRGQGCPRCAGVSKMTNSEFIEKSKVVHSDKFTYEKVSLNGAHKKVVITCKTHGDFEQTPAAHIRLKQGCPLCSFEKSSRNRADTLEDFIEKAKIVHGNTYNYSKVSYERSWNKVEIICKEHGPFFVTPYNHLQGKSCGKCIPGGFQPQLPGYVYILESDSKVKIGITNKNPLTRVSYINSTSTKDVFKLVHSILYEDGRQAQSVEKQMLSHFRAIAKTDNTDKFNGYTECFVGLDVQDVLVKLKEIS